MNRKMFFLTFAAACGLSAQSVSTRITAQVPFPFDFAGMAMAAGNYEVLREGGFSRITLRNLETGKAASMMSVSLENSPGEKNGMVFEKGGGQYSFLAMMDGRTNLTYRVGRTRKQAERAAAAPVERVYVAAR